jgi:hypothetical protein
MTGPELVDAMRTMGWNAPALAAHLDVPTKTVRDWMSGRREVPANLASWIQTRADAWRDLPDLPEGWHAR